MKKIAAMNKAELKHDLVGAKGEIAIAQRIIKDIEGINQLNIAEPQREENEHYIKMLTNYITAFEKKQRYIESQLRTLLEKENGS